MDDGKFRKAFLILLVVAISAAFFAMIRQFLMTILLAGIFSGLAYPLYARLLSGFRGRRALASTATLVILFVVVGGPLLMLLGIVASEALSVSEKVGPWIQRQVAEPSALQEYVNGIPGLEHLEPYRDEIYTKLGQLVGSVGSFFVNSLSATTRGTVAFFFHFFLFLYTMFYFLMDGDRLLEKILYYMPLPHDDEARMVDKFVSVTRATLKGTILIGITQGVLGGAALALAGVHGAAFWGTIMTVLSIIPGIGIAVVWVPAALILLAKGQILTSVLLALFCGVVIGSVDNVMRPRLVGRDTEMHDLLILFATLGGIFLFGVAGFIIGPVIAALFVTIWEIYGVVFRDVLPAVGSSRPEP